MAKKFRTYRSQRKMKKVVSTAEIIRVNLVYLCENTTNFSGLKLSLVSTSTIIEAEQQVIMSKPTELDKFEYLYLLVAKKGNESFEILMEALNTTGNEHIYRFLEQKLASPESEAEDEETSLNSDNDHRNGNGEERVTAPIHQDDSAEATQNDSNQRTDVKYDIKKVVAQIFAIVCFFILVLFGPQIFYPSIDHPRNSSSLDPSKTVSVPIGLSPEEDNLENGNNTSKTNGSGGGIIHDSSSSDEDNNYDFNNLPPSQLRFLRYIINSPISSLPSKLPFPSTRLNVTIESTVKYDWRLWEIVNSLKVYELSLKGCFNESDVHHFLRGMKNLRILNLSRGAYICEEFTGETAENGIFKLEHNKLDQLHMHILPECELLYKYLADLVHFRNLRVVAFNKAYITYANMHLIDKFFLNHESNLVEIYFDSVTLCQGCELFDSQILFPHLEVARFTFLTFNSTAAVKTLRNFSRASSMLSKFHSNVSCDIVDTRIFEKNWKHLDYRGSELCQD